MKYKCPPFFPFSSYPPSPNKCVFFPSLILCAAYRKKIQAQKKIHGLTYVVTNFFFFLYIYIFFKKDQTFSSWPRRRFGRGNNGL